MDDLFNKLLYELLNGTDESDHNTSYASASALGMLLERGPQISSPYYNSYFERLVTVLYDLRNKNINAYHLKAQLLFPCMTGCLSIKRFDLEYEHGKNIFCMIASDGIIPEGIQFLGNLCISKFYLYSYY